MSIWIAPTPVILGAEYTPEQDLIRSNDLQFLYDHRHDVLYIDRTQQTLANSTTKTAVATYVVPAGMLSSNGILTVRALVRVKCTTSNPNDLTVGIEYGGTSLGALSSLTANNNSLLLDVYATLVADGATNVQVGITRVQWHIAALGDRAVETNYAPLAIDSTVDQNLILYLTNSRLNADASWTFFYLVVYGLP
jgi:hypothetical protein